MLYYKLTIPVRSSPYTYVSNITNGFHRKTNSTRAFDESRVVDVSTYVCVFKQDDTGILAHALDFFIYFFPRPRTSGTNTKLNIVSRANAGDAEFS